MLTEPLGRSTLLEAARIAPERRAETLSIAEFDRLAGLVEGALAASTFGR